MNAMSLGRGLTIFSHTATAPFELAAKIFWQSWVKVMLKVDAGWLRILCTNLNTLLQRADPIMT